MEITPVTDEERRRIIKILKGSKSKLKSENFLEGFPWKSTEWYSLEFENIDLLRFFLFWDGSAWKESPNMLPRRLKIGVDLFMMIDSDQTRTNTGHLDKIKDLMKNYELEKIQEGISFIILAGEDHEKRLLIIDGNHRISAAVWCAIQRGDFSKLPQKAWIGLSPYMTN